MNPEENMDDHDVFIPISEETLSELSSIDSYTVSNMAKELIMLRSEVRRLRAIEAAARALLDSSHTLALWSDAWEKLLNALAAKDTP